MARPVMQFLSSLDMDDWNKFKTLKVRRRLNKDRDVVRYAVRFAFQFAPEVGKPMTLDGLVQALHEVNSDGTFKLSDAELHNLTVETRKEREAQLEAAKIQAGKFHKLLDPEDMTDDEDESELT